MIRALTILILGTFILSVLSAPLVFELFQQYFPNPNYPFSRIFDRVAMLCVVILLLILKKDFKPREALVFLSQGSWQERFKIFLIGATISVCTSLLFLPLILDSDVEVSITLNNYLQKVFLKFLPAAILVSIIEEIFFRGLLLKALSESIGKVSSVLITSALYAIVHFITPLKSFVPSSSSPLEGFRYISEILTKDLSFEFWSALLGMFLVGITLALSRLRTNSIYICIGLHVGWIIVVKSFSILFLSSIAPNLSGVSSRYYLLTFPQVWVSTLVALGMVVLWSRRPKSISQLKPAPDSR